MSTEEDLMAESSCSAIINAPIEAVDIPAWCFTLTEAEYQACSPAHVTAAATTAPDGRRMSINVEVIGGGVIVQHYVEEIGEATHLRLVSQSDVFTPTGRVTTGVIWDLRVRKIDEQSCELTNTVRSTFTPRLLAILAASGIPREIFQAERQPVLQAHNRQETPLFARSIERHALRRRPGDRALESAVATR